MKNILLKLLTSFGLIVVLIALLIGGCAAPAPAPAPAPTPAPVKYHWKIATCDPAGDFGAVWSDRFKENINNLSDGQVEVEVYTMGTLGDCREMLELCQRGEVDFLIQSSSWSSRLIPQVNILNVSYLLPRTWQGIAEALNEGECLELFQKQSRKGNLEIFGFSSGGWQLQTANKPLLTIDDFKGLKVRVMASPIYVETFKLLGANPTPMPFGEVYSGLQMGLVESQQNPIYTINTMKFYEVQEYIINPFGVPFVYVGFANYDFMQSLPKDIRDMTVKAHKEALYSMGSWVEKAAEAAMEEILEAKPSIVYIELTPEQVKPFKEALLPVRDVFLREDVGGEGAKEILEALLRDVEKVKE